ncbi:MAG: stage II sporulation protein M [Bacteroidales bacterium]|jgi:uncharacterized membrane protein SpoIIM required for sporulation|nr:stage II sporulation protein M [Bacteroidales bacterium]
MKEAIFYVRNKEKWKQYEHCLKQSEKQSPDALADIYIDLVNDLSFVRTHYPHSHLVLYLNGLSSKLHQFINRKKTEKLSRFVHYWLYEVPETMYDARKELLVSFIIVIVSALIGVYASAMDENYKSLILGNQYVEMTLDNIAADDPMAVYKDNDSYRMFFGITFNNIWVSFRAFIMGMLTSIGTAYVLFKNGVMLGCFHYMFYENGLMWDSFLTIWIHGSLEIPTMILDGAAGIALGNGWLFPKTYRRMDSFRIGARRGLKIIVGTIPFTITAAFLESYLTRHTELPDLFRLLFILLAVGFAVFYFVIYPYRLHKKRTLQTETL